MVRLNGLPSADLTRAGISSGVARASQRRMQPLSGPKTPVACISNSRWPRCSARHGSGDWMAAIELTAKTRMGKSLSQRKTNLRNSALFAGRLVAPALASCRTRGIRTAVQRPAERFSPRSWRDGQGTVSPGMRRFGSVGRGRRRLGAHAPSCANLRRARRAAAFDVELRHDAVEPAREPPVPIPQQLHRRRDEHEADDG